MSFCELREGLFKLDNYDVMGFDMDHTIVRYDLLAFKSLIYDLMTKFLVQKRGYPSALLDLKYDPNLCQKGLILDKNRGNLLKLSSNYSIMRAAHGTHVLSEQEIQEIYGPDKRWETLSQNLGQYMKMGVNREAPFYVLKDFFITPCACLTTRLVQILNENDAVKGQKEYKFFGDMYDSLMSMFKREAFAEGSGGYFSALKANPSKYLYKCSDELKQWLVLMRERGFKLYLLTSSNADYAQFLSEYSLGSEWRSYFDLCVTFARKPSFFSGCRPFLTLNGFEEESVLSESLREQGIYSQGNWKDLHMLFSEMTKKSQPRCLYFGDSIFDDVHVPDKYAEGCDTIAIVEEIDESHRKDLSSEMWGSFFVDKQQEHTLFYDLVRSHSRLAIPSLESMVGVKFDESLPAFSQEDGMSGVSLAGFIPASHPLVLSPGIV